MVIAIVMTKIHAHPVRLVRQVTLAMMANRALTVTEDHPVPAVFPFRSFVQAEETVVDVLRATKAIPVELETLADLDPKVQLVNPAEMVIQEISDQPVQPDQQARKQAMAEPAKKDNLAPMLKMENVAALDPQVELDKLVPLVRLETEVPMLVLAAQAAQVHPVQLATQATMEHPEIPVRKDNLADQAKIAIIVPVQVTTKRRSKLKLKLKLTTLTSVLLDAFCLFLADKHVMSDFYLRI